MQFCPAAWKQARMNMDANVCTSASGSSTAGSFPPSSSVVGVSCVAAAAATRCPTASLPINVMCAMRGSVVSASAYCGAHTTSCTSSGEWPHAARHWRTAASTWVLDHATCSEHLITTALPENRDAITGPSMLCTG